MDRSHPQLAQMTDAEAEEWKRKNLPLKWVYTDFDFTPAGKVALLRRRGYADVEIAAGWPDLAQHLQPAPG